MATSSEQGFNIMGAVSYSWNRILRGSDRDFVNGNQPNRGLSIDTRGTPIATVFNIGANAFQTPTGTLLTGLTLTLPNGANGAGGRHQHPRSSGRRRLRVDGRRHGL